jgi:hypothetical protein
VQAIVDAWSACSDGVTIDVTPPKTAGVYLGEFGSEGQPFQTTATEMSVVWGRFVDIEEEVVWRHGSV